MIGEAFSLPADRVVFFASTNRLKIAEQVSKLQNGIAGSVKWPIALLHLNSITLGNADGQHSYNTRSFARHGVYVKVSESQTRVLKVNLVPTVTEIEVIYMTDSFAQAFAHTNLWMANAVNARMNFTATYMNTGIDIRCALSDQVSTPDREESVDQPNVFEYTSTIKVFGYSSDPHVDGTSYIQVLSKPEITVRIDQQPTEDRQVYSTRRVQEILKDKQ